MNSCCKYLLDPDFSYCDSLIDSSRYKWSGSNTHTFFYDPPSSCLSQRVTPLRQASSQLTLTPLRCPALLTFSQSWSAFTHPCSSTLGDDWSLWVHDVSSFNGHRGAWLKAGCSTIDSQICDVAANIKMKKFWNATHSYEACCTAFFRVWRKLNILPELFQLLILFLSSAIVLLNRSGSSLSWRYQRCKLATLCSILFKCASRLRR
jgi:hypothetical protein